MRKVNILMLITVVMIIGCTEDKVVEPRIRRLSAADIELRVTQVTINAFVGTEQIVTFTAVARDIYSNGVSDVTLTFSVVSSEATIIPESDITDQNGMVKAVLALITPSGEGEVTIIAESGQVRAEKSIQLFGTPNPVSLEMELEDIDPETDLLNIKARVLDVEDNGIPDLLLEFTLIPFDSLSETFGSIMPLFRTDEDGTASVVFNSLGQYGRQKVRCEVAEPNLKRPLSAEVMMEITEIPEATAFQERAM